MSNDINLDTPRTGSPSPAYKEGWDRIWRKRQISRCAACGQDVEQMCRFCSEALRDGQQTEGVIPKDQA